MPRPAAWEPAGARVEVPKVSPFPLQPHSHTQPIEAAGLCRDYQPKHRSTTGAVRRTGTAGVHRQLPADNQRSNHRSATPCRQDRRRSDALPLQPALPEPPPPTPGRAKVTRTPSGRPAPPPAGSRGPPLTPHRPRAAPPPCPARGARWDMESRPGGLARSAGRRALQIPGCLARRAVSSETRRCGWGGGGGCPAVPPPMAPRARPGGCQDYPSRGAPRGGRHGGARGGAAPRRPGPLGLRGARLQGTGVTRRDVSRGDVRRSDVTVPRGGRERGTVAVPGTGGHPCGGGGERCRPECSRGVAGPLLPPAGSGRVGSGRVGGRRHGRPVPASRLRRQDEPPCSARGRRQAALPPRPPAAACRCSVLRSASPRRPSSGMKPPGCERLRGRRRPPHHHLPSPAGRQAPLRRGRRTGRPLPRGSGELPSAHRGPGAAVRVLGSAPEEPSCAAASAGG